MQLWRSLQSVYTRIGGLLLFVLWNSILVLSLFELVTDVEFSTKKLTAFSLVLAMLLVANLVFHAPTKALARRVFPLSITLFLIMLTARFVYPDVLTNDTTLYILSLPVLIIMSAYGLIASIMSKRQLTNPHISTIGLLLIIALLVRIHNVHIPYFFGDEYETISAAYSLSETGDFYKWDWMQQKPGDQTDCITTVSDCRYTRAWPFTVSVAASIKFFGLSEWSARLPGVLFSVGTLGFIFLIVKKLMNSNLPGLITVTFIGFSPYFIETARFSRMYAMLWFVFWGSMYLLLLAKDQLLFRKRILLVALGILGLIFSYIIHPVTLVMLPGLVLSVGLMLIQRFGFSKKYLVPIIALAILGMLLIVLNQIGHISLFSAKYLTILSEPRYDYLDVIARPFHVLAYLFMVSMCTVIAWKKKHLSRILPLLVTSMVGVVFFVFFGGRYMHPHYISLITITLFMLLGIFHYQLFAYTKYGLLITALSIGTVLIGLHSHYDNIYQFGRNYGKYPIAYQSLIDGYQPGDVVISQFLRTYYLQNEKVKDAIIIDMGRGKSFTLDDLKHTIQQYPSGFLVWDTIEEDAHIDRDLRRYACANFTQLHGENCKEDKDATRVEVFQYDEPSI